MPCKYIIALQISDGWMAALLLVIHFMHPVILWRRKCLRNLDRHFAHFLYKFINPDLGPKTPLLRPKTRLFGPNRAYFGCFWGYFRRFRAYFPLFVQFCVFGALLGQINKWQRACSFSFFQKCNSRNGANPARFH